MMWSATFVKCFDKHVVHFDARATPKELEADLCEEHKYLSGIRNIPEHSLSYGSNTTRVTEICKHFLQIVSSIVGTNLPRKS